MLHRCRFAIALGKLSEGEAERLHQGRLANVVRSNDDVQPWNEAKLRSSEESFVVSDGDISEVPPCLPPTHGQHDPLARLVVEAPHVARLIECV
jgi:hypothetical protein